MTDKTHFSEDPQLTAYALGELAGEERAAVEAQLREHPERRAAVEEIKAAVARLEAALKAEPAPVAAAPANAPGHARAGEPRKHGGGVPVNGQYARPHGAKLLRFPQVYYVIGGLAAAGFAVVVALHESPLHESPRKAPPETSEQIVALPLELPAVGLAEPELAEAASPDPQPGADRASDASGLLAQVQAEQAERRRTEGRIASMARVDTGAEQGARDQAVRESIRTASYASTGRAAGLPGAGTRVRTQLSDIVSPQSRAPALTYSGAAAAPARSDTEAYAYRAESDFLSARENPLSTFSADVDTASYANVRRMIVAGTRPPVDAVRIEEMLNYFPYRYAAPAADRRADAATAPFAASLEVAAAPWAEGRRLVRIGLKGREVTTAQRSAANLVFLVDVSGSMNQPNKLPLVKESMRLLLGRLRADDRVAIVTYAGASGLALPSTPVAKAREIEASLEELAPAGSTNGAMGIHLAYDVAKANFVPGGVNRVILCTDGDFNVGVTSEGELVRLIEEKAKSGVFLTVLGFGMGNLKDATLQQIADRGNGSYGYVDTRREAEKLLVEQVNGTLVTIAKDVKLQVEFNPARVASYRLIGYEKRLLQKEDFNNDAVDAGEIGAGHTVTALYEIVPVGAQVGDGGAVAVDELKYQRGKRAETLEPRAEGMNPEVSGELLTLKVRYKDPSGDVSRKLEFPLTDVGAEFAEASDDFKFAAAVAGFGMLLRESPHKGNATFASVTRWAESGIGADAGGYRAEFVELVRKAEALQ